MKRIAEILAVLALPLAAGALLGSATPTAAQGTTPNRLSEERWQDEYDARLKRLEDAETKFNDLDANLQGFLSDPAKKNKITDAFRKQHADARALRDRAMRELDIFLRRSGPKRKPLLADVYVERADIAARGGRSLERVSYLSRAEDVLRDSLSDCTVFITDANKRIEDLKAKGAAGEKDADRLGDEVFYASVLQLKVRKALAEMLMQQVVYPAIDEFEVFYRRNDTVAASVETLADVIRLFQTTRDDLEDLRSGQLKPEHRLLVNSQLDGMEAECRLNEAWSRYYRAWLSKPDPKNEVRRGDLEKASDTFQGIINSRETKPELKLESRLGYALVAREMLSKGGSREQMDGAVKELQSLAGSADVSNTKVQATWELARTYAMNTRYKDALGQVDKLEATKKQFEGKDEVPGAFYLGLSPAMRLSVLFEWKTGKNGGPDAEKAFADACQSIRALGGVWVPLVDSYVNRILDTKIKDRENPTSEELAKVSISERITLSDRYLSAGNLKVALRYLENIMADAEFEKLPNDKKGELLGDAFGARLELFEAEKLAAKDANGKPPPDNLLAALKLAERIGKSAPGSATAKKIDEARILPGLVGEIERVFGRDEAKKLLGGAETKINALRDLLAKNPNDPKADDYRLALARELEAYAEDASQPAEKRAKAMADTIAELNKIRPAARERYITAQQKAAFYQAQLIRSNAALDGGKRAEQMAGVLRKATEVLLKGWREWNPPAEEAARKVWQKQAATYATSVIELVGTPPLNNKAEAFKLIELYDKEFDAAGAKADWNEKELSVKRDVLRINYLQESGKGAEAKAAIDTFLAGLPEADADKYLTILFSQTRRLIDSKEIEARKATSNDAREGAYRAAASLSDQLVVLATDMKSRLGTDEKSKTRARLLDDLIMEMKLKSGKEEYVKEIIAIVDELIKKNKTNNGQYQIFKAECLTQIAVRAPKDTAKWVAAGQEWLKLTKDEDLRTRPDYRDYYWQAWYNTLGIQLELTRLGGAKREDVLNALQNLQVNYGRPTERWEPFFLQLKDAVNRGGSVYIR